MSIADVIRTEREKRKAWNSTQRAARGKEMELNWALDRHDLAHRLDKLQQFLRKGERVEISLTGKRRGRQATFEQRQVVLDTIRDRIRQTDGAREYKSVEGKISGPVRVFAEGKKGE